MHQLDLARYLGQGLRAGWPDFCPVTANTDPGKERKGNVYATMYPFFSIHQYQNIGRKPEHACLACATFGKLRKLNQIEMKEHSIWYDPANYLKKI